LLDDVRARFPGDEERVKRMSLIGEDGGKSVRMAHLATVGSHAKNGVAALHSELLKASVLKDIYEMWLQRFSNKTNGVTPRRFLALANPGLRRLLDDTIGDGWVVDLEDFAGSRPMPMMPRSVASGVPSSAPIRCGSPTTFARRWVSN
jgi:starch phosphorylase